jgi:hypothetical protein
VAARTNLLKRECGPHVLAEEIADDLRANLDQIEDVLADLEARAVRLEKPASSLRN